MINLSREEFKIARDQYIKFRREQEKYRRFEKELAKKSLYKETDKLLEVADFLFDIQEIEKAEIIYNLVEEKVKEYEAKYQDFGGVKDEIWS
ncbi:hypothetical protein ACV30B_14345 [Clostridium perfringens]|uniref:Uncharacterized protein n=3 Tax=Clostridium perfringens TaxID=1502 RepID=A0AAP7BV56_CLOPF|nr:hypothetical protein [Clostridium perfringens]EDT23451.1 hypothetical protein AC1_2123 [Clostridium perfringens B str. ATCC 3626]EIF6158368.1 hypothetical protein [Clostridium perfringens]MBI6090735.1 hypothetical protein [Clostridium perfringens]MDB2061104.1 hypothetical protein [Clostridium perfringens]MDB2064144.1 hypothetical protein [Clostridium perfringens]